MGNIVEKNIGGQIVKVHTTYDRELSVMHDFLSKSIENNTPFADYFAECEQKATDKEGLLLVIRNGFNGFSFYKFSEFGSFGKLIDGEWVKITEFESKFNRISGTDLLDYCNEDFLASGWVDDSWTEKEKSLFCKVMNEQRSVAKYN